MAMAECKCRQCGKLSATKEWSARKEPACPHCGHAHFSISFQTARPPTPVQEAQPGQLDALGRHKKIIRLENFTDAEPGATIKPGFRDRMRAYRGRPGKLGEDDS